MLKPWNQLEGQFFRVDVGTSKSSAMSSTAQATTIYFCTDGSIVLNGVEMGYRATTTQPDLTPYAKTDGSRPITGAQKFTHFTSIQHTYNGYSVLFRNDGDNFYIMLTNKGSNDFNSFRPIRINIKTGDVELCGGKLYVDHDGEVRIPGALRVGKLIQSVAADEPMTLEEKVEG